VPLLGSRLCYDIGWGVTEFHDRRIVLGVTGSIAAFKAAALASELTKAGAQVRTVLTAGAQHFISRLTFETLTGQPVMEDLWEERPGVHIGHLELARWAEVLVVAPASASSIARLALGLADDALGAVVLASEAPLLVAPAMETHMYRHPAIQAHLETLHARGATIVGPVEGRLASGAWDIGRMVEPAEIMRAIAALLADRDPEPLSPPVHSQKQTIEGAETRSHDLAGVRIVITAGPTREPIDPVRYLSNRSSGKMGYALAEAAWRRGAQVTLVSGPVESSLITSLPAGVKRIAIETAREMRDAVLTTVKEADVVIMAAAVADFRPAHVHERKIKKTDGLSSLALEPTDDILQAVQHIAPQVLRIGFAAETENLIANALDKLQRKGLALVVANEVDGGNSPFGSDYNRVTLVRAANSGSHEGSPLATERCGRAVIALPRLPKKEVAERILDAVADLVHEQRLQTRPAMTTKEPPETPPSSFKGE
jgi:phosphopantothenoylcysteine decarboxylase/phosphopantothenate--cysteine ligase